MQSPAPTGAGPNSAITLSLLERPVFAHLFNLADPQRTGLVTGDAAVAFFAKSKLPPAVLGQIWAIADSANNGFLTPPSFSIALRLIAHAQRGEPVTEAIAKLPAAPPTFEGITLPLSAQATGSQPAPTINMPGIIEIKPEDRARYTRIFASANPSQGLIDGEKSKEIFVKSKLPFDKLGAIWNLADTQARGSLDLTDFIIGMHFIQNTMNGSLNSIPAVLPPGMYEQAKGNSTIASRIGTPTSPISVQHTGGSASGAIQRQMTGPASRTFSPAPLGGGGIPAPFQSPQPTGAAAAWDVTAEEKLRADRFFDGLDSEKKGVLDGAAVVPFFMQSKLTETVLAHIWDLSDVTQNGALSKDEFAVAMHLINGQLAGKELPQELPQSLVPPSMRNMNLPQAVDPQQSDTQKDLFSLMDDDPPPPTVSAASAFITPTAAAPTISTAPTPSQQTGSRSGPFDDDFFGGAGPSQPSATMLSPAPTGGSLSGIRSPAQAAPGTPFGADQGADFGNKSNQLQSTQKAVTDLQSSRSTLESAVATNAFSLAELESRLTAVKTQHETESKLVKDLETRQQTQAEELRKLREEVIRDESALSALKAEKDELEQAVMRDREDVRDLKKRMGEVQVETKTFKETLEKLRKDARQQKGLVAISKKQLATAETEQEKVKSDIGAAERGEVDEVASPASATRDLASPAAVGSPLPGVEAVLSPAASVRSTNPFDRFGPSSSRPESPAVSTSAQPSTSIAIAADVGATAVLGGAAADVVASSHNDEQQPRETDPFGVPTGNVAPAAGSGFDDAFDVTPAANNDAQSNFDDNFGDNFGAKAAAAVTEDAVAPATSTAFDDAFGGFDEPAAAATEAHDGFDSSFAPAAAQPEQHAAAQNDDDDSTDEDNSSDDDEGPEDIDGFRPDSPDEAGAGKAVATEPVASEEATPISAASDRFPEIKEDSDQDGPFASTSQDTEPTIPGGLGAFGQAEEDKSIPQPAPVIASAIGDGRTASTASIAPISRQTTGATEEGVDRFQDAVSNDTTVPASLGTAAPPTLAIGTAAGSSAAAAPLSPSADDDDVPLGQIVAKNSAAAAASNLVASPAATNGSLSPSSSIKTRRAPPPAPVRTTSTSTAPAPAIVTAPAPNPFDSGAPTSNNTTAPSSNSNNFDDFDSAFEDLGQAVPAAGGTAFDDTFDNDFDFVPSFANTTNATKSGGGGFEDFDSAFDPPAQQASGSGFSFEDTFSPSGGATAAPPVRERKADTVLLDDAGPVKQLCGMGFARSKVIEALEKSNYRTEKALERLLASA